jgi:DNA (cytosine-5)-methyltransferase 1
MKNGKRLKQLSQIVGEFNIRIDRAVNDKNAYLTHLIQEHQGWSDDFITWANEKYAVDKIDYLKDSDVQLNLFPVNYDNVPFPPPPKGEEKFTFIDLFAGIGGFRIAMQDLGGRCVFSSEWDINSQKTYFSNFGEIPYGDITKIEVKRQIPYKFDILCGGFPCQPFSIAGVSKKNSLGKAHGFLDETQGTLFYDIVEILGEHRPKAFILENVKNLRSHDKGKTYKVIKEALKELNYTTFDEIMDAKYYVPQHRERIFIVGFDNEYFGDDIKFDFPEIPDASPKIKDILEKQPDAKYTLTDHLWTYLKNYADKHNALGNGFGFGLVNLDSYSRTLSARYHKDGSEILIPQGPGKNPRRLTPNECKALMGYPNNYKIDDAGVSQTQLYRQFGNSVAVPVVEAVAMKLINALDSFESSKPKRKSHKKNKNYATPRA